MKVSELRLGNYILHNGEVMPVVQIERRYKTIFRLNDKDVDERIIEDHFQPIPLTPEWLERCGFNTRPENRFYIFHNERVLFEYFLLDGTIVIEGGFLPYKIKFLHHLQNLYFTLTGEELTINNVNLQTTS